LKLLIYESGLDIIGIAETWLGEEVGNVEIRIEGYKIYRKDRSQIKHEKRGGVLLYVKNDIITCDCGDLNKIQAESIWCKIVDKTGKGTEIVVGVCYKRPAAEAKEIEELFKVLQMAAKGEVLIMGDFNYPGINWETFESNNHGQAFRDLVMENFLIQHVREPTRESNVLDLVMSSNDGMVENLEVKENLGNSDHNTICWSLICDIKQVAIEKRQRRYQKGNYKLMRDNFQKIKWEEEFKGMDVENMWKRFCMLMELEVEKCVPVVKASGRYCPKWMNRAAKVARRRKVNKWKQYRESGSYNDLVEYKLAAKMAEREYRKAKRVFEEKVASEVKSNPKSFYAYVRSKTSVKEVVGPLRDREGKLVTESEGMCGLLNDFFASVFTNERQDEELPEVEARFSHDSCCMLDHMDLTEKMVVSRIRKLKVGKAPGIDGIVPKVLVECADVLGKPLWIIYNLSLRTGKVPVEWKRANVTAIFKKGSKEVAGNYRPVSLTTHVCKVLEALVKDVIIAHLQKYNLINDSQHGFVKGRSCLTNLLGFFEDITAMVDKGEPVDVIYLDFQKAFDKVPHRRLMKKVSAMGIGGEIYNWIEDWLRDRKQRVCLTGSSSGWANVSSGVPQGSVLGPLLFLIYINDIDNGIASKILKFADDTKLYRQVGTAEDIANLRSDLGKLVGWSKEWLMLFNVEKCKVMHIGVGNGKAGYKMDGVQLQEVHEEMDLGVLVQDNLKCAQQCAKVVGKANRVLGMIKRTFKNFSSNVVMKLYKCLIRPRLEYAVQAWRPYLQKDIDLIEGVQRRATKLVVETKGMSYEERLKFLDMTTLETRRVRGDLIEVFKIMKGFENVNKDKFFTMDTGCTRGHELKLFKPSCRLDCRKYAFSNRIINMWNSLPSNIIACNTVDNFKHKIDIYLYGQGFI
jgi:ribonuclease P/MRP protein subunit RPP40